MIGELISNTSDQYSRYLMYSREEKDTISTGWRDIDGQIAYSGLMEDMLFYLLAKSSVGKTYFVCNWIRRMLGEPEYKKILFFSLEMSFNNIMDRFLQGLLAKNLTHVREYVKDKDNASVDVLEKLGFFKRVCIYDGRYNLQQIDRIIGHERPTVIFIDHLHRIKTAEKSIFDKTTALSGALVDFKKKYSTRIICMVQLKREGTPDKAMAGTRIPVIEDGKGSGAIEEDGDFILGLARPDISANVTETNKQKIHGRFIKNRFPAGGYSGIIVWKYDPATSILSEEYD